MKRENIGGRRERVKMNRAGRVERYELKTAEGERIKRRELERRGEERILKAEGEREKLTEERKRKEREERKGEERIEREERDENSMYILGLGTNRCKVIIAQLMQVQYYISYQFRCKSTSPNQTTLPKIA